ncbi:maleylpyruvate isomerase family mycothiol-dependent enzyme [Arthrobacter sp. PL16]|uniref:maleylpyruvate isomerase family mycothiol-dependent enzyme n=1 Tax=Arthrobacter sp. PL16 TaxID=3071720 RepID=UPI002E0E7B64
MKNDWQLVHQERQALAEDLASLTDAQWSVASSCVAWDVHDVVAHLIGSAGTTRRGFWVSLARAGFDFDRANAREVAAERAATPAETLRKYRASMTSTTRPPGPFITRLIEIVVHGEDIRRPLGIERPVLNLTLEEALIYLSGDRLSGGRRRLAGLELTATDEGFTIGSGQVVLGPALSLLLVASGRPAALENLQGPGLSLLQERLNA